MFKVKEEEMSHLVEERRFIRRLKERDDTLSVRNILRRSLDDLVYLLVERFGYRKSTLRFKVLLHIIIEFFKMRSCARAFAAYAA